MPGKIPGEGRQARHSLHRAQICLPVIYGVGWAGKPGFEPTNRTRSGNRDPRIAKTLNVPNVGDEKTTFFHDLVLRTHMGDRRGVLVRADNRGGHRVR